MNNNDETQKVPAINSDDEGKSESGGQKSPVKGFDPSKTMFVPADKNSTVRPAVAEKNDDGNNTAGDNKDEKTGKIPEVVQDKNSTIIIPAIDNEVKPEYDIPEDIDATAEIPAVQAENSASEQKVYMPETTAEIPVQKAEKKEEPEVEKTKPAGKKTYRWLYALCISIVAIILCGAVITTYVFPKIIEEGGTAILHNVSAVVGEPPKNVNVLLVGTDKEGYRTDTIMVATYDNDTQTVHVMQIPRDTYVKGNGRNDKKINSAYFSGIDTLKSEIFKAFGIEIHRYLAVELDGFVEIIDAIGGVEVDVPINMHYDDPVQDLHIHINKGLQLLDGKDAEGFVRYRKGNDGSSYPLGDIDRMKAQKQFVQNAFAKLVSIDGISKIPELISIVKDNIETDISTAEATSYATKILSLSSESINFYTAPGVPLYKYGGWYYFIDGQENRTLVMEHFNGEHNKKSYSPIYFDLTADPYESETASANSDGSSSADISDDERYSYYSPENDMGYYDEDETSGSNVPVIDDDETGDEDTDGGMTTSSENSSSSVQQDSPMQNARPSSSQSNKPSTSQSDKPSSSQSSQSSAPNTDSSTSDSTSTAPKPDDTPVQPPATDLPSDAPQIDFD